MMESEEPRRRRELLARSQASPEEELRILRAMRADRADRAETPPSDEESPPYEAGDPGPGSDG